MNGLPKRRIEPVELVIYAIPTSRQAVGGVFHSPRRATANCWRNKRKGKKRRKRVGRVDIPQEAFLDVLKVHGTVDE